MVLKKGRKLMKKVYTAMNEAVFYYCIGSDLNKAKTYGK